ncbi:glycosyltransferase family 2 protein [Flavobacterium sp. LB1P71]|uniref:glycosyltransferase family 2 protein n=1 Tax=unclassified Flavobacterium TaxID=196869 RepID=UPI003AB09B93
MKIKKLSIITINLNDSKGLEKTIKSVITQTFINYEFIIIDGASTDKSIEIIKQYKDFITFWKSEPDTGIYNAMNKGIKVAQGEFCLFLNSGDVLFDNSSLEKSFSYMNEDIKIASCRIKVNNKIIEPPTDDKKLRFTFGHQPCHQATFIHRSLFNKYGYYNEMNRIASDVEFFFIAMDINGELMQQIPVVLAIFDTTGISSTAESQKNVFSEMKNMYARLFPEPYNYVLYEYSINLSYLGTKKIEMIKNIDKYFFLRRMTSFALYVPYFISKILDRKN